MVPTHGLSRIGEKSKLLLYGSYNRNVIFIFIVSHSTPTHISFLIQSKHLKSLSVTFWLQKLSSFKSVLLSYKTWSNGRNMTLWASCLPEKFPCQNGGNVASGSLVDSSPSFCVTMKKYLSESHSSACTNWPENANC